MTPTDTPEEFTEFKTAFMQEIGKMVAEITPGELENWMMGKVDPLRFDSTASMKRNLQGAMWGFSVLQRARQLTNCDEV